jgi:phosphoribosylaminoimidazolecarboxamide formyltransferase/IMP cyclohydrolase
VAWLLADAVGVAAGGRQVELDVARADDRVPRPHRALLSVSDKAGLVGFARGLVEDGFELVSTGGTARVLREAGLAVTDVAGVTGAPEMLDGRVKTLHPRIHAGILADGRLEDHRRQLVEEIDIGGPSMVRAAAKNHASVAIVTSPARYEAVLDAVRHEGAVRPGLRAALAVEAFRHTAAYDARISAELPARMASAGVDLPDEPGLPGATDPFPASLTIGLEKVETLRYGENPHQAAARYRRPGTAPTVGPFATGEPPLQGKALSYNNVLDASAAAAAARLLRGPACVIVKHTNPCGAAERAALRAAWDAALAGDPVSAFGGVVALTRDVDVETAEGLASLFLEVIVAPGFDDGARRILAPKTALRLIVDRNLGAEVAGAEPDPLGSVRSAGGAILVGAPDTAPDDPAPWQVATTRGPTDAERRDLDLAWRLCRGVTSNAIVLVRDGRLIGFGSGQTSRVDAARQAVEKARAISGADALTGASCASDAFYPFPDAIEACLEAGVTAFVQPGGSKNDADAIAAAEAAGATMLLTGVRHFRH